MKKRLSYILSFTVLVVFSLYLVPHEVVHVFYDHHDTEHGEDHGTSTTLSEIHIHCDFLSGDLTDFLNSDIQYPAQCSAVTPFRFVTADIQNVRCVSVLRDSRGPPLS